MTLAGRVHRPVLGSRRDLVKALGWLGLSLMAYAPHAAEPRSARRRRAGPSDYRSALAVLQPGDVLELEPGEYTGGLSLHGVLGSATQPIVVEGPERLARAVLVGRPGAHTISLVDSAHVVVRHLVLDGRGAAVDGVRAEGHARWAHHITLEGLTIVNHAASQQNSGISTKCPAWGWVIRGNTIIGAGTGMYFGDSDGSDPFFDSVIEGNRILDSLGYGIQVKHQVERPASIVAGHSAASVIRGNVIVKGRVASAAELARPSLLVGHWPLSGPGSEDRYLIYGNLLFDNPSEALFQGEGNIAFYNNLLVNPRGDGLRIQPHNHKPREVAIFNNTVVAAAVGVEMVGGEPGYARLLEHNLVYGNPAVRGEVGGDNRTGDYDRARAAFVRMSLDPTRLDLTPSARTPAPAKAIDRRWLALPAAQADRLGRPKDRPIYGACQIDEASAVACR